jgi:hypothetical protein
LPLIFLLATLARAGDHGTLGVAPGLVAASASAALDMDGEIGLWGTYTRRPWSVTAEVEAWNRVDGAKPYVDGTSLYRFGRFGLRGSAVAEVALGTHATTFHLGLGPAVTWTHERLRWAGHDVDSALVQPGIRGRMAVDGPIGKVVAWEWSIGVTSRAFEAVDWDSAIGLGVQW